MGTCQILLGWPWQYDINATHRDKRNIYMFTWEGKRIAMKPIPPPPKPTKEVKPKFISIYNIGEFLWNPRRQSNDCFGSQRRNQSSNWNLWEDEADTGRNPKNSSWWALRLTATHKGYPASHWSDPRSESTQPPTLPDESKGEWGYKGEGRRTDSEEAY